VGISRLCTFKLCLLTVKLREGGGKRWQEIPKFPSKLLLSTSQIKTEVNGNPRAVTSPPYNLYFSTSI